MTGSGSRKSAPPAATDTSSRCCVVVVAVIVVVVFGAETAALTPDLALKTFVDPYRVREILSAVSYRDGSR